MNSISQIFGVDNPIPFFRSNTNTLPCPHPGLLYGIELEIENASSEWCIPGMDVEEDGSLRNHGYEFITAPMTYSDQSELLRTFFDSKRLDIKNYSERTSIHVHSDCTDLTLDQLSNILVLYQIVEKVLFHWIGNNRDDNIFCVPWSQTITTYNIINNLQGFMRYATVERNKYTALNLVPLAQIGTIEWRHMNGHCDVERILLWLRIIGHFYRVATSHEHATVLERATKLNSSSEYERFLDWLFQEDAVKLKQPGFKLLLEDGVLNMKFSLIGKKTVAKTKLISDFELARMELQMSALPLEELITSLQQTQIFENPQPLDSSVPF